MDGGGLLCDISHEYHERQDLKPVFLKNQESSSGPEQQTGKMEK
jgi:hypothetical protein